MLLMARNDGLAATFTVLGALAANLVLVLLALMAAGPLMRLVGPKIEGMVTRLLGVILAALAVQFVLDGIKATLIAELATS
jgi:multiple antibiotic resistance protein